MADTALPQVPGQAGLPGYQPDPQTLQNLGSIVAQLAKAKVINKSFVHPPRILAQLPAGALYFDSNLELDTDGWAPGGDHGDQDWQSGTSLHYNATGPKLVYLNANEVPYFVLPLPTTWPTQYGISLGDYAAVLYKNFLAYAVFGDFGPKNKLGEGSIELLRLLGQERIRGNNQVIDAGMGPGIITIVFPGSARQPNALIRRRSLLRSIEKGRSFWPRCKTQPERMLSAAQR